MATPKPIVQDIVTPTAISASGQAPWLNGWLVPPMVVPVLLGLVILVHVFLSRSG